MRTLKASPLQSVMLRPLRTLMSSTAISPQLFASTKLSITTLKKAQIVNNPMKEKAQVWWLILNQGTDRKKNQFCSPGKVCWFVEQGHDLPSSDCLGDHWLSTTGCQLVRLLSVCAVWYAMYRCVTQTYGTKKTRRGLSPGNWPQDWPGVPPWSLEDLLLKCRWSSLIHLSEK